ncbi:hypothetical protein BDV29DRAFT_169299 [Aspergillus leporis]|uniref:Uncharacterized protein n=1 Tax=Aspergillus leporis TaxID=41062 RepID=A0A5N5X7Y8_9EURO|nr:hypothetical protein BDV29DRAFT_169299 [Aspergillus leporis]
MTPHSVGHYPRSSHHHYHRTPNPSPNHDHHHARKFEPPSSPQAEQKQRNNPPSPISIP